MTILIDTSNIYLPIGTINGSIFLPVSLLQLTVIAFDYIVVFCGSQKVCFDFYGKVCAYS